jgi:hypothetical protein
MDDAPENEDGLGRSSSGEEDEAPAHNQRVAPVTPPPGRKSGVHEERDEQQQAQLTDQHPGVGHSSGVCDRIIHSSHPAYAAVATEASENSRFAHAVRLLNQTNRWIAASVRDADAAIDQMTVTQLMAQPNAGGPAHGLRGNDPRAEESQPALF